MSSMNVEVRQRFDSQLGVAILLLYMRAQDCLMCKLVGDTLFYVIVPYSMSAVDSELPRCAGHRC